MLAPARTVLADELDFTTNDMNVLINEEDVLFEGEDVLPDDVVDIAEDNRMYTITYRAGNVGSFDTSLLDAFELGEGISWNYTSNYVKVDVPKNTPAETLSAIESVLQNCVKTEEGYMLLGNDVWGVSSEEDYSSVRKNDDFVLDYGVLVDPVSYTIEYVDAASGEQIATSYIGYGNAGDVIVRAPLSINGYTASGSTLRMALVAGEENVMTFTYTSTNTPGTVVNTVINYITTPAAAGGGAAAAAGAADGGAADNAANDNVTILDEDSAANESIGDGNGAGNDAITIDDEESAANMALEEVQPNTIFTYIALAAIAIVVISIAGIGVAYSKKLSNIRSYNRDDD